MDKGAQKEVTKRPSVTEEQKTKTPPKHFRIIIKLPLWMHVDKSLKRYEKRLRKWRKWKEREIPQIIDKRDALPENESKAKSIYNLYLQNIYEEDSRAKSFRAILTILASMSTLLEEHQRKIIELETEVWRLRGATKSTIARRTKMLAEKIEKTLTPIKAAFDEMATEAEVQSSDAKRLWS